MEQSLPQLVLPIKMAYRDMLNVTSEEPSSHLEM